MDAVNSVHINRYSDTPVEDRVLFKILNTFAVELISVTDENELAWYVAREVVGKLGYIDCVVYFVEPEQKILRQIAAIGDKNPRNNEITNLLEIPIGVGITGQVAQTQKPIVVNDLQENIHYIPDLIQAKSEICVPLIAHNKILGVIDCEDPRSHHFNETHLEILQSVASLTSAKLEIMRKGKALLENERRNQIIFNSSLDGIISVNSSGNIVECNPSAESMFGLSSNDIIGKPMAETIIPPELVEQHQFGFKRFLEGGNSLETGRRMETIGLRSNGDRFPLEVTVTPYILDGKQYLTGFLRDLSDVKKAEEIEKTAKDVEQRFSAFIEHLPSAFLIKDLEGHYLHANTRWHKWFNPTVKDMTGNTVFDILTAKHSNEIDRLDQRAVTHKKSFEKEMQLRLPNGRSKTLLIQKFPILNDRGEVIAIGGVNTDISHHKKMEEDLRNALLKAEEANQSKSVFLSTMSHELRTPLNAIIGFSDMICGEYFGELGDRHYLEYAKGIQSSGKHLSTLIDDVLDIASIEFSVKDLSIQAVELDDILHACVNSLRPNAEERGINLVLKKAGDLPEIFADSRAMKQIFLNLLTNSLKYCNSGDEVNVSATLNSKQIFIEFADTGIGIEEEYLPKLTEPFVRGHRDCFTSHEGVGLGLSIVKSLVDAHQGNLNIESKAGKGTNVTVIFPCNSLKMDRGILNEN